MVEVPQGRDRGKRLYCEINGVAVELRPGDLSSAGLFLPESTPAPLDGEVSLVLHSSIGELAVQAQVVQVISKERAAAEGRNAGSGLLFIDLGDDQRAFIGLTLDALLRSEQRRERARAKNPSRRLAAVVVPSPAVLPSATAVPRTAVVSSTAVVPNATAVPSTVVVTSPERALAKPAAQVEEDALCAQRKRVAEQSQQALRQLQQDLASIQNKPSWVILDLPPGADAEAARQAFLRASKRYHPHVYAHFDNPQLSKAATDLFIAHKKAFDALTASLRPPALPGALPPSQRPPAVVIDAGLAQASAPPKASLRPPPVGRPGASPSVAAGKRSKPPTMTRLGDSPPSKLSVAPRQSIRPVAPTARKTSRPPTVPSAQKRGFLPPISSRRAADAELALAAGLKHLAASRFEAAVADFERACSLHPDAKEAEVWLRVCRARKAKARGHDDEALQLYRKVLELEPDHREALVHTGGRDPRKRVGLISKFFGPDDE